MQTATNITRQDIVPFDLYRKDRDQTLQNMIAYKKARRIKLSPDISLLFENRDTVLFQIQELANSEDLTDPKELDEYIEIYAGMLPADNELSATMFVETDDQECLQKLLVQLKGIEHHLWLRIGGEKVQAVFEEVHDDREFTTSVHYIKFPLTERAKTNLLQGAEDVHVQLDHPQLTDDVKLTPETIASLKEDLQAHMNLH